MQDRKEETPHQEVAAQEDLVDAAAKEQPHANERSDYAHQIFISHRGTQKAEVAFAIMVIFTYFCGPQFAVFDEVSLPIDKTNEEAIFKAIESSKHFLAIVSEDFFTSKWTVQEVNHFLEDREKHHKEKRKLISFFMGLSPGACRALPPEACLDKDNKPLSDKEISYRQTLAKELGGLIGREQADGKLGKLMVEQPDAESVREFLVKQMKNLLEYELAGMPPALLPEFKNNVNKELLHYVYDGAVSYYKKIKGKATTADLYELIRELQDHAPKVAVSAADSMPASYIPNFFSAAAVNPNVVQLQDQLKTLEENRKFLLEGTAYKKRAAFKNLEELSKRIKKLDEDKNECEEEGDDFPPEKVAYLEHYRKTAESLLAIDEEMRTIEGKIRRLEGGSKQIDNETIVAEGAQVDEISTKMANINNVPPNSTGNVEKLYLRETVNGGVSNKTVIGRGARTFKISTDMSNLNFAYSDEEKGPTF